MSVVASFADGCQRVLRAPVVILGAWLVAAAVRSPLQIVAGDSLLAAVDATTLDASAATLTFGWNDRGWLAHLVVTLFLLGGVMDRLARDRATASFGFFGACGMYFFRFGRLALIAWPIYAIVLLAAPRWFDDGITRAVVVIALVAVCNVWLDYARVRMVVEDRRSALGALAASARFIGRHLPAVATLTIVNGALAGLVWWLAVTFDIAATLAVYAYLLARTLLRLIFVGSVLALFQSRLAHAGYMARRVATWPESPAAEAVLPR